ncbi:SDR family NAD(P)-dependent oxidoreductase [Bacillus salitolerans]|uniref:SDR family NAD(P)-dependent oxidoreductase n=1 Tax=Bacillus salitolerans TaxID=1437434 RepID=A0ABW4LQ24_9BACI
MDKSIYFEKKILIIGGSGTIGNYLLEELLKHEPKVIRVFSRDEFKQFELQQKYNNYKNIRYLIGDIRDEQRVTRAMEDIDYVFHLAAMKHVPSCEYNPFEAVKTNVIGTQNIIQAALQTGVKKVLFTSSDKAISPTNTYGATKLTAERLIAATQFQKGPKQTIFLAVRFGNVMGSRGSVIPLFKEQILKESFVTITDENMLRYMMTPNQAISLLLRANELAKGGEVFVLKMPIIKLKDLVEIIIEEMKTRFLISKSIDIKKIGIRPGEKLYEELMTEDEARIAIETNSMYIIPPAFGGEFRNYPEQLSKGVKLPKPTKDMVISKNILRQWMLNEDLI